MTDIIIGKYKIETSLGMYGTVHKALGPWPLNNWSWISFYGGSIEDCKSYIGWATRLDSGDRELVDHVTNWYKDQYASTKMHHDSLLHLPKILHYNFKEAVELYPKKPDPETSPEIVLSLCMVLVIILCTAIYHMM